MSGKPLDPDYHAKYRAANRDRINEQERARRKASPATRQRRHQEETRRRQRRRAAPAALEVTMAGHALYERAVAIVGPRPGWDVPRWEDEVGTVALALLERRGEARARAILSAMRRARAAVEAVEVGWTQAR